MDSWGGRGWGTCSFTPDARAYGAGLPEPGQPGPGHHRRRFSVHKGAPPFTPPIHGASWRKGWRCHQQGSPRENPRARVMCNRAGACAPSKSLQQRQERPPQPHLAEEEAEMLATPVARLRPGMNLAGWPQSPCSQPRDG